MGLEAVYFVGAFAPLTAMIYAVFSYLSRDGSHGGRLHARKVPKKRDIGVIGRAIA
jgi:hypothetical protein